MAETLGVVAPSGGTPHDPFRTAVVTSPMGFSIRLYIELPHRLRLF